MLTSDAVPPETYRKFLITTEYFKSQISTYKVLNVEFFPQESHLVTFRDPWETTYLFHPVCAGIVQKHVEDMAQKVSLSQLLRQSCPDQSDCGRVCSTR